MDGICGALRASCLVSMLVAITTLPATAEHGTSDARPFDGRTFHGRIAFSSDGNCNDEDDWGAFPVAAALLDAFGVTDRLVHVDYSNILPKNDPRFYREMETSVRGSAERFHIPSSVLFDCQKDLDSAIESIKNAINASSADDPLYYVLAGPMEVPLRGIQQSDPDKRKFVYCISHSVWNDGFPQPEKRYLHRFTKADVIQSGVQWVQVKAGSGLTNSTRTSSTPEQWQLYHWMRDSKDARLGWIYSRLETEGRCDVSDATMVYFLLTGDETATPAKLRAVLDLKQRPTPVPIRSEVRIEAENFQGLDSGVVERVDDRGASHRLSVQQARAGRARIRTTFNQPYAAADGVFDIEVRYRGGRDGREGSAEFQLFVGGIAQGEPWTTATDIHAWQSKVAADVPLKVGDELMVEVHSDAPEMGELDYVELRYKGRAATSH